MDSIDVRDYLYHGVNGWNANSDYGHIYIFKSILKTGFVVDRKEAEKFGVSSVANYYTETHGFKPRISLGFYPLDQKTFELSKNKNPYLYGDDIAKYICLEHHVKKEELDEYIMNNKNLNHVDGHTIDTYAWHSYYNWIVLLLDKKLLEDLKISDFGYLIDEICIDERIDIRKYLKAVGLGSASLDKEETGRIKNMLKWYDYDIPVVKFPTGEIIEKEPVEIPKDFARGRFLR